MTEIAPMQDAMLRLLFAERADEADLALLAPEAGRERERIQVYRELGRHRIHELVRSALPRTSDALGDTGARIDAWLAIDVPRSRFFRDLPLLFAAHLDAQLEGAPDASVPPFARDLLALESARWRAMIAVEDTSPVVPFDLEKVPAPSATLHVLSPGWSVHREGAPEPGRFFVCVYRRPDHVVETRWSERVHGRLVEAWARADRPAIDAVRAVLADEGLSPDHAFVERMSELLTTLLERGALRGSRP